MTVRLESGWADSATLVLERSDEEDARPGLAAVNPVVLLHHDAAPGSQLLSMLADRGLDSVVVRSDCGEALPDPLSIRQAVVFGSKRFSKALECGTLNAELEWLRQIDAAGGSVLGIGHGARALAVAFGGGVEPTQRPIRGWVMVDTLVPHRVATGPWLTWQHDVITLPPGAVQLAHNRLGPQAFQVAVISGSVPSRATPETVVDWVTREDGPIDVPMLLSVIKRDPSGAAACTRRLFATFLNGSSIVSR